MMRLLIFVMEINICVLIGFYCLICFLGFVVVEIRFFWILGCSVSGVCFDGFGLLFVL